MLTRRQASRLLDLFTDEALTLDELEYWAQLVAPRLDIEYEDDAEAIKEMVYVLANPQSNWRLDIDRAYDWIVALDVPGDSP